MIHPLGARKERRPKDIALWLLNNGPAIVTVLGGATVAFTASVMKLSELQILQAVVALLALIGTSLLTERLVEGRSVHKQLSAIDDRLGQALKYASDVEGAGLDTLIIHRRDLPALEERLHGARQVSISGGSLFRLANEYLALLEQLAQTGCKLQFLLTDPDTSAAETLGSAVVYESNDVHTYRAQIRSAIAVLSGLVSRYPGVCELKLCSIPPSFSLMVVERQHSSTILVELYPFKLPARDRPMFLLDKQRDPRLYRLFSSQYHAMWSSEFASAPRPSNSNPHDVTAK
jgi:hypothetical protein